MPKMRRPKMVDGQPALDALDATTMEGKTVAELNNELLRALVSKLAGKAGGLNNDGTIKPLDQW